MPASTLPFPPLRTENLTKRYGRLLALDDLDLTVTAGQVFGFLGPNGAGQVHHHPAAARPGPPDRRPGVDLRHPAPTTSPRRTRLALRPGRRRAVAAADRRGDPGAARRRSARAPTWPTATSWSSGSSWTCRQPGRTYSTGNRQKVALVAAFATRAPLLVLDEPTSGLDPLMEQQFRAGRARGPRPRPDGVPQLPPARRGRGRLRPGRRSCAPGGWSRSPTSPTCAGCTAPRSHAVVRGPIPDLAAVPGVVRDVDVATAAGLRGSTLTGAPGPALRALAAADVTSLRAARADASRRSSSTTTARPRR